MLQYGLRINVVICLGVLYDNNIIIEAQGSGWLQNALNVPIGLFRRYGLIAKVAKSWMMMFRPRALRLGMLEDAVGW